MKKIQEIIESNMHYEGYGSWHVRMNELVEAVENFIDEEVKNKLVIHDVSHCYPEAFCEYLAENYTKNLGVWFPKNADQKLETNRRSIKQLYDKWHRVNCG